MNRPLPIAVAACAFAACSAATDAIHDPSVTPAQPALGVAVSAAIGGASAFGDSARVVIHNTSAATRYLSRCGTGPLILVGTFENGAWSEGVQNFACVASVPPGPVQLAAGDSLIIAWAYLTPGSYRFEAFASTSADLSNMARTTSNSVTAR